jgi:hypothetical protein
MVNLKLFNKSLQFQDASTHTVLFSQGNIKTAVEFNKASSQMRRYENCSAYIQTLTCSEFTIFIPKAILFPNIDIVKYVSLINSIFGDKIKSVETITFDSMTVKPRHTCDHYAVVISNAKRGAVTYAVFCAIRYLQNKYYWPIVDFMLAYDHLFKDKFALYVLAHEYIASVINAGVGLAAYNAYYAGWIRPTTCAGINLYLPKLKNWYLNAITPTFFSHTQVFGNVMALSKNNPSVIRSCALSEKDFFEISTSEEIVNFSKIYE